LNPLNLSNLCILNFALRGEGCYLDVKYQMPVGSVTSADLMNIINSTNVKRTSTDTAW
jgi:hypothetical protein